MQFFLYNICGFIKLCDVGRVAVNDFFKLLRYFTFIFAVLLQFLDCTMRIIKVLSMSYIR